jgi:hypothetical protein
VNKCATCSRNTHSVSGTHNGFALSFSRNDSARLLPGVVCDAARCYQPVHFDMLVLPLQNDRPLSTTRLCARRSVAVWAEFQSTALNRLDG